MNILNNSHNAINLIHDKSPLIFTIGSVTGTIATVGLTVNATIQAVDSIAELKETEEYKESTPIKQKLHIAKKVTPLYSPVAVSLILTNACSIASYKINSRRLVTATTMLAFSEARAEKLREKLVEKMGKNKAEKLEAEADKELLEESKEKKVIKKRRHEGDVRIWESISNQIFWGNPDDISKAESKLNHMLLQEMAVTFNEFCDILDIDQLAVGDSLEWQVDKGYVEVRKEWGKIHGTDVCMIFYDRMPIDNIH